MTKKKSTAKKKEAKAAKRPAALGPDRQPRFTKAQLQKWRMLDAEARASAAELRLAAMRFRSAIADNPDAMRAYEDMVRTTNEAQARQNASVAYFREVCAKIGVDPAKVAIDDRTGVVVEAPAGSADKG